MSASAAPGHRLWSGPSRFGRDDREHHTAWNPAGFVAELGRQGVGLEVAGDRLHCRGPVGLLTPALKQRLAAHKAALVAYLKQAEPKPGAPAKTAPSSGEEPPVPRPSDPPSASPSSPQAPQGPAGGPEAIRLAVIAARDWEDLEPILDAVQAACEAGGLDRAQAENLARLAARVSRAIPARVDGIKAEELLPPQASQEETDG